jgi:hypothetical protein
MPQYNRLVGEDLSDGKALRAIGAQPDFECSLEQRFSLWIAT